MRAAPPLSMASSRTSSQRDPVFAIMGWCGEPLLLKRLSIHILEAVAEATTMLVGVYLSGQHLAPAKLFIRLLSLPLVVVFIKILWALILAWGYFRMRSVDFPTAMQRMGCQHSRGLWSCSVAMFTCFSCLLMVWHAIVFLLMLCYEHTDDQAMTVRYMLCISAIFVATNWVFWRDFVQNYRDSQDEITFTGLHKLQLIYKLYKSKAIRLLKLGEQKEECRLEEGPQKVCVVCLEDFSNSEVLAQLPCGHIFHPSCINKWVLEDWRCPFRCPLEATELQPKQPQIAWSDDDEVRSASSIEARHGTEDIEQGTDQTTTPEETTVEM
jgi:hypothetical protein